jgi:hypothetical protein
VALGVVRVVVAKSIVVTGHVDFDLVIKRAAAGIVELVQDIPGRVARVPAVGGIRGKSSDDAGLDSPVLEEDRRMVVGAAEAEGFLGAVLDLGIVVSNTECIYRGRDILPR